MKSCTDFSGASSALEGTSSAAGRDWRFPCGYVETYAAALLEISNYDDACQLDIIDLINGGWVDDFNDIAKFFGKIEKTSLVFDDWIAGMKHESYLLVSLISD